MPASAIHIATTTSWIPPQDVTTTSPLGDAMRVKVLDDDEVAIQASLVQLAPKYGLTEAEVRRLSNISFCESGHSQYDANGHPLWSPTRDVGAFQINEGNIPLAVKLGYDVVTSTRDNVEFAIYLYQHGGVQHWKSSQACWGKEKPGW